MQEAILTNVIHFAPIGILALLLIMVLILVANLRQTKKINKTDRYAAKSRRLFPIHIRGGRSRGRGGNPGDPTGGKKERKKHEKSRRCGAFTGRFDGIFLLKIRGLFARI